MSSRHAVPVGWRLPLLVTGGVGLLGGLYAALILLDLPLPDRSGAAGVGAVHGPVMVFGFVGTLVALERAVALGARWGLLAPACSGLGALLLLVAGPGPAARLGLGDWAGLVPVWRWAGVVNEVSVAGFVVCAAALALRARRPRRAVPHARAAETAAGR
ncbi:hypothetical protein [Dactylosporangium sp. NPDC048998]|uniref:hypothetical protein n=1 Tax=Dactylosporangium sp. NPDC048998 TaxID=3363976 RepID=UPI00370FE639